METEKLKGLSEKYHDVVMENKELKSENEFIYAELEKLRSIVNAQRVQLDMLHSELNHKSLQKAVFESMGYLS